MSPHPAPTLPRWTTAAAMTLVLVVVLASFALSFTVLRDLAALSGIPVEVAWLWPVIVDGTIAAATLVFYTARGRGRGQALLTLVLFGLASIVGNTAHILLVDPTRVIPAAIAVFVGVMPPVGLILTVELLGSLLRSRPAETVHGVDQGAQPELTGEPEPAHAVKRFDSVDQAAEPEPIRTEPVLDHGPQTWPTAEPAVEPRPAPLVQQGQDLPTPSELQGLTGELIELSGEPEAHEAVAPLVSLVRDEPAVDHRDEPSAEPLAQPVGQREPSTEPPAEPEPAVAEPDPVPETVEAQVAWVADRARAGEPVTASTLVDRFAEAGLKLSLSTAKRRLSTARQEHPDAFEAAS